MSLSDKNKFEFEIRNIGGSDVYYKRNIGDKLWLFSTKEEFELNKNIMDKKYSESAIEKGTEIEMEHAETIKKFMRDGVSVKEVARAIAIDHLEESPTYYEDLKEEYSRGGNIDNEFSEMKSLIDKSKIEDINNYEYSIQYHSLYEELKKVSSELGNFDSPKLTKQVEDIIKDKFYQELKKRISLVDGKIRLFRAIKLKNIESLNTENLGIYWGYNYNFAQVFDDEDYEHKDKDNGRYTNYVIKADFNLIDVNWSNTLDLYITSEFGEGEIRLKKDAPAYNLQIQKRGDEKWLNIEENICVERIFKAKNGGSVKKENSDRIECRNPKCDWSWSVESGGDDLYVCHKCYTDNEKFYVKGGSLENDFEIEENEDGDRITISLKGIGEVILVQTSPQYEFIEDIDEDTLEELNVSEDDMIGKIEHLEVNDKFKGKGYAKSLMNKAIEIAEEYGWMPLYLNASPMGSKRYGLGIEDLTGFYESFGFNVFLNQGGNNLMLLNKREKFSKGGLIAPNGEPSNLTPKQWKLVRTPEFKAWFGDWQNDPANASKVVDKNGEPLICYHGTDNEFYEFDVDKQRIGWLGKGFYFSENKIEAKDYGKRLLKVFLNIKNPFIIQGDIPNEDGTIKWALNREGQISEKYNEVNADDISTTLKKFNNDGVLEGSMISCFYPKQIKLADGTNTTFDGNNPDIRFEDGGEVEDLINQGIIELKMFATKPEHAKEYGLDSVNPLFVQSLNVNENKRLKGVGKKVLQYIDDYAIKNGHDVVFGHINKKATMKKDNRTGYFTEFTDIDFIKHWLFRNGYNVNRETNDFYKVIASDSKDINDESKSDIHFADGGRVEKEISFEEVKKLINYKEYVKVGQSFIENPKAIYKIFPNGNIDEIEHNPKFFGGVSYKTIARKKKFEDGGDVSFKGTLSTDALPYLLKDIPNKYRFTIEDNWLNGTNIIAPLDTLKYISKFLKEKYNVKSEFYDLETFGFPRLHIISDIIDFADGGKIQLNSNKGKVNLKLSSYEDVTELVPVSELLKLREFDRNERPKYSLEDSKDNISKLEKALVENGVEEPLIIEYSLEDNSVLLIEGNHRLNVAENLGFDYLPARVVLRRREFAPLQKTKALKVKGFTPDRYGYVPSDLKPSQVGIGGTTKAFEEGGVVEGQLHSECNEETGCGEKYDVGGVGHIIEVERDEAVIVSKAFQDNNQYEIKGTPSEIASALNVLGDGKNFDSGAEIKSEDGKKVEVSEIKKEAKNTDVETIDTNSIIINRRSMYDEKEYVAKGTPKQIASQINNLNDNGVKIVDGGSIKKA